MKKGAFSKKKGTLKTDYERPFTTPSGRSSVLRVVLTTNYKKGLINVAGSVTHEQIGTNKEENFATLKAFQELQEEAMNDGISWRALWQEENREDDPDQLDMFADEDEQED